MSARLSSTPRQCTVCKAQEVFRPGARVCSLECAAEWSNRLRARERSKALEQQRSVDRVRREKLKPYHAWLREAQSAFNAYRREVCRIAGYRCICCGHALDWSGNKVDAGHYRSRGSAPHLRFVENNVWAQRKQCNRWGAGRAVDYRIGLIARIGVQAVEALEADQAPRTWSIDELKAIKLTYKNKLKALRERKEDGRLAEI